MSDIISDFDKMSVKDLQNFAKDHGLKGFTGLKKHELIAFIVSKAQQAQQAQKAAAEAEPVEAADVPSENGEKPEEATEEKSE